MRATLDRQVKDIMHYGVITVSEATSVSDMCRMMSDNRVSCVAVTDYSREIVGVVSSTDIIAAGTRATQGGRFARAGLLMTTPLITVDAYDPVQRAMEVMVEHHIHRVMVRLDGHVIGILSTTDIVREIAKTVKGNPEAVYSRHERYEAGVHGSGESQVARETVYDVMTHGVLMIPLTLTLRETAKVMSEKEVHRVIVVSDEGEMIGVVAGFDILKPWTQPSYGDVERDDVIAADVMTQDIEAIEHWRRLPEAMSRMAAERIHALLVLLADGEINGELARRPIMARGVVAGVNVPIGLVSATDIVREIGRAGATTLSTLV
jgi:CBS domain-containing protein